jgi:transposase
MTANRKYPDELRERALRMVFELRHQDGRPRGQIARVSRFLGIHPESLRLWVKQRESGEVRQPGPTETADSLRIAALEREVRALRRAIETLQGARPGSDRTVTLMRPAASVNAVSDHSGQRLIGTETTG